MHAWAFAGDLDEGFELAANTFEVEWPPRSGKTQRFPEVDRASFFSVEEAREKINVAQTAFLDRLIELLDSRKSEVEQTSVESNREIPLRGEVSE